MADSETLNINDKELKICASEIKQAKNKKDYRELTVADVLTNEKYALKVWSQVLDRITDNSIFRRGNIIKVRAEFSPGYDSYNVYNLELLEKGKIGLDFQQTEAFYKSILAYVESIEDERLRDFISSLIKENEEKFKTTPASTKMHHNYLGGLLVHTHECLEIAKNFLDGHPKINKNDIYAASILHDFGKIFEYSIDLDGVITYNNDFKTKWISHSQWAFSKCMSAGFEVVAKMIATHHGRIDWGAVIDLNEQNLDAIYYLLHHIDDLSAKFGKISIMDI